MPTGAFATCHCLNLPRASPAITSGAIARPDEITRRSEWFVTKSPIVTVDSPRREIPDLVHAAALLRSVARPLAQGALLSPLDRRLDRQARYGRSTSCITSIPSRTGSGGSIARTAPVRRTATGRSFSEVAQMVEEYLDTTPDPAIYDFLKHDFDALEARHGGVVGTSFRPFPSYPQRFIERLAEQPACSGGTRRRSMSSPGASRRRARRFTEDDLHVRQFLRATSRSVDQRQKRAGSSRVSVASAHGSSRRQHPPDADEPLRPIRRAEALDADDAARAGRVDELVAADAIPTCDAPVRRREEDQDRPVRAPRRSTGPGLELSRTSRGSGQPVLREDPLGEAAAVEAAAGRCRRSCTACREARAQCRRGRIRDERPSGSGSACSALHRGRWTGRRGSASGNGLGVAPRRRARAGAAAAHAQRPRLDEAGFIVLPIIDAQHIGAVSVVRQMRLTSHVARRLQPRWLDTSPVVGQNFKTLGGDTEPHMEQTLLLNASYEPLKIVTGRKASRCGARAKLRSSLCTTERSGPSRSVSSCRP